MSTENQQQTGAVILEPVEVIHETGETESVQVPTMKLGKYQAAYAAHDAGDEFRFVEVVCDKHRGWAIGLTPESYDRLVTAVYQRNQSFFGYAGRQEMKKGIREAVTVAASRGQNLPRR